MISFINHASARQTNLSFLPLNILMIGDSIVDATAATYPTEYSAELATYGITSEIYDAAQGGLNLDDFYDAGAVGAYYTARVTNDNASNLPNVDAVLIGLGTNDGPSYGSKSAWKANLQGLVDALKADTDLPRLQYIFIRPLGRYTSNTTLETSWQDIRQAQIEVTEENEGVFLLPPYYDVDLADSVHPVSNEYGDHIIPREARQIAYVTGKYAKEYNGFDLSNPVIGYDGVTMTVTHEQGTDFTVPTEGQGLDAFAIGDKSFSSIKRLSATEIQLYSGAPYTGTPDVKVMEGAMYGLGLTNVPCVRDNSTYTIPPKASVSTASNPLTASDPILQLTNLAYYMRPTFGKTTTTGTQFDNIASVNGGNMSAITGDMNFDTSAFGGNGGVNGVADTHYLQADGDLIDPTNGFMFGTTVAIDSTAVQCSLFAFGRVGLGAYSTAYMRTTTNNRLYWFRSSAGDTFVKAGGVFGGTLSIIMNVRTLDNECDIYVDDATTPAVTFTMHADFPTAYNFFLNKGGAAGNALNKFGLTFAKSGAHDSGNDPSLATLMAELNNFKNGL